MADNPFIKDQLDSYIEAVTNPEPVATPSPTVQQSRAWLGQNPDINKEEADQASVVSGDAVRAKQAEGIVSDQSLTAEQRLGSLQNVANSMGQKDDASVVAQLVQQLAADNPSDAGLLDVIKTRAQWVDERTKSAEVRAQLLEDFKNKQKAAAGAATYYAPQAVGTFLLPTYAYKYVNILRKYSPDFSITDYVGVSDLKNEFRRRVNEMNPEDTKHFVSEVLDQIKQDSGTIGENNFEAVEMAQQIFGEDLNEANVTDNIFQVVDLLQLGGVSKAAGSVALKGGKAAIGVLGKAAGTATEELIGGAIRGSADPNATRLQNLLKQIDDKEKAGLVKPAGETAPVTPAAEETTPLIGRIGEPVAPDVVTTEVKIPAQVIEKPVKVRVGTPAVEEKRAPIVNPLPHDLGKGQRPVIQTTNGTEHEIIFQSDVDKAIWGAANAPENSYLRDRYFDYLRKLGLTKAQVKRAAEVFKENIREQISRGPNPLAGVFAKGKKVENAAAPIADAIPSAVGKGRKLSAVSGAVKEALPSPFAWRTAAETTSLPKNVVIKAGESVVVEPSVTAGLLAKQTKRVSPARKAGTKLVTKTETVRIPGTTKTIQVPAFPNTRIAKGTVASAATRTTKGVEQAVSALNSPNAVKAAADLGTTPEQIFGSLVSPKVGIDVDEFGRPYNLPDIYKTETVLETSNRIKGKLANRFQQRVKDFSFVSSGEYGHTVFATLGDSTGRGFVDDARLQKFIDEQLSDVPHTIVEKDGEKFVQYAEYDQRGYKDISSNDDLVEAGGWWKQWLGRDVAYKAAFNKILAAYFRSSTKAAIEGKKLLDPYLNAPSWKRAKISHILDMGDDLGKVFARHDPEIVHLTDEEYGIYTDVRRFFDRERAMSDFNARTRMEADGWLETDIKGESLVVRETKEAIPDGANIIELGSNRTVAVDEVRAAKTAQTKAINQGVPVNRPVKVFELFDDQGNVTHAVSFGDQAYKLKPLRPNIGKVITGYIPRQHDWAFYVYDKTTGKSLYGAKNANDAERLAERARAANPDAVIETRPSTEVNQRPQYFDDVQRLREEGLLYSSKRNPVKLVGIEGVPRLKSVEHAINTALRRYENNAGLHRWTDFQLRQLQATYGDLLRPGDTFAPGRPFELAHQISATDIARAKDAETILHQIERVNGIDELTRIRTIDGFKSSIANALYKSDSGVANKIADEISGRTRKAGELTKSVVFAAYLGTNFARNVLLQSSLIPLYLAREGATAYAFGGRFFNDLVALQMSRAAPKIANKMSPEMVKLWNASGLDELVTDHAFTIGTLADSRVASTGALNDSLGRLVRGLQRFGFNIGVRADKRAAFLIETNAFKAKNGRLPSTEQEMNEVFANAERLSFNQNRSDVLPTQLGTFGAVTQFLSYNVKATGRALALDNNFTAAERTRFWAYSLLTYGFDGFRAGEIIDEWETRTGVKFSPQGREIVHQGMYGTLVNVIGRLGTGEGALLRNEKENKDHPELPPQGQVDISGEVGPLNFIGPKLSILTELFGFTVSNTPRFDFEAPAVGLGKNIYDVLKFGMDIAGAKTPLPTPEKAEAITAEFFRKFPLTNNFMKAYVALRQGYIPDGSGSPVTRATTWEALGQVVGAKSTNYEEIMQLNKQIYGSEYAYSEPELVGALQDEAKKNADIMAKALLAYGGGDRTVEEVKELAYQHAVAYKSNLQWADQQYYFNAYANELDRLNTLKSERLVNKLYSDFNKGALRPDEESIKHLELINHPDVQSVKDFLKSQQLIGK